MSSLGINFKFVLFVYTFLTDFVANHLEYWVHQD